VGGEGVRKAGMGRLVAMAAIGNSWIKEVSNVSLSPFGYSGWLCMRPCRIGAGEF